MLARASAVLALALVAPSGKPATVQTFTGEPRNSAATSGVQNGLTQTLANSKRNASAHTLFTSALVASGFRMVWSIRRAMERSKFMNLGGIHYRSTMAALFLATAAAAHPLGKLSVNHFARIQPGDRGIELEYVLDLGEMPVFELTQRWRVDRSGLKTAGSAHAEEWLANLQFRENGAPLAPRLRSSEFEVADSPGDLATMRITLHVEVPAKGGRFEFEDGNYATRSGWREIVIDPGPGAEIMRASESSADPSSKLRAIPEDAPVKNDRSAWMEWRRAPGLVSQMAPPVIVSASPTRETQMVAPP